MRTAVMILMLAVLALAGGLALGVAFAPRVGEANCHTFQPYDPGQDRGGPLNPIRCKPDGFGGMKCSSLY